MSVAIGKKCYGCGACVQICPVGCLQMKMDNEGFMYPLIDQGRCIECKKCENVCPVIHVIQGKNREKDVPRVIGGWILDEEVRKKSSSGGAFSLFANRVLEAGGSIFGCILDENMEAKHVEIRSMEELDKMRGSKYIQSRIGDAFVRVMKRLKDDIPVLFVGTPCQCAGLHRFLELKDSGINLNCLLTIDFICHGVPSEKVFRKYIRYLEKKNSDKIVSFKFRCKDNGWNPSGLQMGSGTQADYLHLGIRRRKPGFRDPFMDGFLSDLYLRKSCYNCGFKKLPKTYSDITIADFWGSNKLYPELFDGKGTSLVLINSKAGESVFKDVEKNFHYIDVNLDYAMERNRSLVESASMNYDRTNFFELLDTKPFLVLRVRYLNGFYWGYKKISYIMREKTGGFIKFSLIGVSNVAVSYLINISTLFLMRNLHYRYDYIVANVMAWILSVLWSFYWNSIYVFKVYERKIGWKIKALLKIYLVYACTGLLMNNILSSIWIYVLGISKYLSPILNLPFSVPINFFLQKNWAYK